MANNTEHAGVGAACLNGTEGMLTNKFCEKLSENCFCRYVGIKLSCEISAICRRQTENQKMPYLFGIKMGVFFPFKQSQNPRFFLFCFKSENLITEQSFVRHD